LHLEVVEEAPDDLGAPRERINLFFDVAEPTAPYYETEGLLAPTRRDNGYRDYGAEEVLAARQIVALSHPHPRASARVPGSFGDAHARLSSIVLLDCVSIS